MQKTLLALAILSFAAAASAAPDSQETPLHPIKDGRYTVTTGYKHSNTKSGDVKQNDDGFVLSGRADIPLAQRHAVRAELDYSRQSYDFKRNGLTRVDGGKADNIDLYAGYLYSPSGFKQGGLRVGGGLGYPICRLLLEGRVGCAPQARTPLPVMPSCLCYSQAACVHTARTLHPANGQAT